MKVSVTENYCKSQQKKTKLSEKDNFNLNISPGHKGSKAGQPEVCYHYIVCKLRYISINIYYLIMAPEHSYSEEIYRRNFAFHL